MSENLTNVFLLNVPLENDYKNTLYFGSKAEQQSYFQSKVTQKGMFNNVTYQRKDNFIRIDRQFDEVLQFNYVMYQNTAYSNKWFYAFITDVKYVNDGRTDIYIETDVMQTWMFDYTVKQSFVEREHVKDDTIGVHTIPENLELGEYIINEHRKDDALYPSNKIIMGSTEVPSGEGEWTGGIYNGIYSGVRYYAYDKTGITQALKYLADNGKIDAVSSIFLAPEFLQPQNGGGPITESEHAHNYTFWVPKKYGLEGYEPKNNKLKTFPYCYLLVSNGNGGSAIYHYEYFEEHIQVDEVTEQTMDMCPFTVYGALTPGCSIRLIPSIYKGVQLPETEGLNLGKYPQCNWATDQYTNWLTQNGVNIASSIINAGASAIGGAVMGSMVGGPFGTVGGAIAGGFSGLTQIAGTLQEMKNADRVPPQTQGNINCGDVVTASKHNTFNYYNMSIRKEYAQIIDKYFDLFGYKMNLVKVPNKAHRENYWYTKTIDVNITGNIPNNDMNKIKACYNQGITFWRNASNIKDYSVSNGIV